MQISTSVLTEAKPLSSDGVDEQASGMQTTLALAEALTIYTDEQASGLHTMHSIPTITSLRQIHEQYARFLTPHQSLAVARVIARDSPVLVVLPTGGGKTDAWLILLMASSSRLTVVVSPLVALAENIVARSRGLGIN